ncbi:MAG: hypothetical protein LBR33_01000 [Propionibacteriaceae bacterium]|jgi:hypothetical protein|nr:hypothetical protein [Propionibacteriaceae bacterium]
MSFVAGSRVRAAFALLALTGVLAGCADGIDRTDPGSVAYAYFVAMAGGDVEAASDLMTPVSREAFEAMTLGGTVNEGTYSLSVGGVTVTDDTARATLVGEMCVDAGQDEPLCMTNDDPNSQDPSFVVDLVKQGDEWCVWFPLLEQNLPDG